MQTSVLLHNCDDGGGPVQSAAGTYVYHAVPIAVLEAKAARDSLPAHGPPVHGKAAAPAAVRAAEEDLQRLYSTAKASLDKLQTSLGATNTDNQVLLPFAFLSRGIVMLGLQGAKGAWRFDQHLSLAATQDDRLASTDCLMLTFGVMTARAVFDILTAIRAMIASLHTKKRASTSEDSSAKRSARGL